MTNPNPADLDQNQADNTPAPMAQMPTTHVMDHRAKLLLTPYQVERLLQLPEDFRVTGLTAVGSDPATLEVRICSYSLPHVVDDEDASPALPLQRFVRDLAAAPGQGPVAEAPKPRPVWGQVDPETGRSLT